jgi:DeoR/GlpR family transcriptional regulator of sugar metabolism
MCLLSYNCFDSIAFIRQIQGLQPANMQQLDHTIHKSRNGVSDGTLPQQRHSELLRLVRARGQMRVRGLAKHLGVSCETVRRDLNALASQGLLNRAYGGAVAFDCATPAPMGLGQAAPHLNPVEDRIARSASSLIRDGETLLFSGNRLTRLCALLLRQARLTIITNDFGLAAAVAPGSHRVYVLGGQYESQTQSTVGPLSVFGVNVHADCAVIGVEGITLEHGLSAGRLEEALLSAAAIGSAERVIALVPSAAFGQNAFARIGPLECIQALVTDQAPPSGLQDALASARVNVVVAAGE